MRQIGVLTTQTDAERFVDYLLTLKVDARVDSDGDQWAVWVRDERAVERARTLFSQFQASPNAPEYRQSENEARRIRAREQKRQKKIAKKAIDVRTTWSHPATKQFPITLGIAIFCAAVFIISANGINWWLMPLDLSQISANHQYWRLLTPIFLHGGWLHLIFNLLWFVYLGHMIEARRGTWRYLILILILAVVSNFLQFAMEGPSIGISGVVCGLFGYVWIKSVCDPGAGFYLSSLTAIIFLVSLFIWRPEVAHIAHFAGLFTGMLIASFPIFIHRKWAL
ncbi:MAG: rhomboid family intramembrane serine protease [Pirellulales bacterium]|nr:rhomboid family intramembrane serine protease [Pirellulales bacterium]